VCVFVCKAMVQVLTKPELNITWATADDVQVGSAVYNGNFIMPEVEPLPLRRLRQVLEGAFEVTFYIFPPEDIGTPSTVPLVILKG
jgi:hypothetical protein